ncbi:MAG: TolB family protein [Pirellulaceae bacterium]
MNVFHICSWTPLATSMLAVGLTGLLGRSGWSQESLESKYLANVRQVTSGFERAGEGYFSPDLSTIVYQAIRPEYPFYQIFTQPLEGGTPRLISTGRGRTTCAYFSVDGKQILFASAHLNPDLDTLESQERARREEDRKSGRHRRYAWDFDPYMDIYVCDLEGQNRTRLTSEYGYDAEGAYSRDGKLIAYCHVEEPPAGDTAGADTPLRNPDIFLMNADGSDKRRITSAPGYDGGPFISPDGQWIVFRTDRLKPEYLQIHVIGLDGQNELAITNQPEQIHWAPYWHPTKPWLIWTGADHADPRARPNYDLFVMPYQVVDGKFVPGEVTRITDSPAADVLPVFSPDGGRLMWTSTRTADGTSQLFIADVQLP